METDHPTNTGTTSGLKLTLALPSQNINPPKPIKPNIQLVLAPTQPSQHMTTSSPEMVSVAPKKIEISRERGESKTKFEYRQRLTVVAHKLFPGSTMDTIVLLGRAAASKVVDGSTYSQDLENVILHIINQSKSIVVK